MTRNVRRRCRRACMVALGVVVLVAGTTLLPAAPARAVDPPLMGNEQEYYTHYRIRSLHSQGYTGKGTVIAMIDGTVNPNIPELAGANIVDKSPCPVNSTAEHADHGTLVAQLLVAPEFGVAPGATLHTYAVQLNGDREGQTCDLPGWTGTEGTDTSLLIEQAINDGADIITISSSYPGYSEDLRWAMARAIDQGVMVVASMGNDSTEDPDDTLPSWSGICGVGAVLKNGSLTDYTNWGNGIFTAALGGVYYRSGTDKKIYFGEGTSFSTPIVAGFLAIAWQRFDDANANRILQALAESGKKNWNKYTGYGPIDPWAFLNTDPSNLPNENPCESKTYASDPSWQDVEDYIDGTVNPLLIRNDDSYVYRGINEDAALSDQHDYPVHLGTSPRYHAQ